MNILQINYSDFMHGGGAAIAMQRLYLGLKASGYGCKILSGIKTLSFQDSESIHRSYKCEKLVEKFTSKAGFNDIHCYSSFRIGRHPFFLDADIINFHVIHSGFFSYLALPELTKIKPGVMTLHDMWNFTGHCSYSYDCERWITGCGHCPYPDTYPAVKRDSTRWEWKLKDWVYQQSNLTIITPSLWLTDLAKQSLLKQFDIYHIPYGIDTEAYTPLEPELCRKILDIPKHKKVLLFAAQSLKDPRKGGDLLLNALKALPASLQSELIILTLGEGGEILASSIDIPVKSFGYVSSDRIKGILYSAADLFLFPTRADNLPLVLQESMACGTPMVSFAVGGVSDLVRPGVTGLLAKSEDFNHFALAITSLLEDNNLRQSMKQNCREIALQEYPIALQAERYIKLYEQICESK